ncbi:unnamed protein product [Rotaria magnacalcarata]|uniref:Uncharacterized protein n=1 Tax=Rotaria magnacalcarata TaxID=392030 RepID=A0A816MPC6_9BILA|nr:unnamed protein product [Rotaria magnacalcarata]CAF4318580.1 unnamed protein product [Rotaria magnacalcarata]
MSRYTSNDILRSSKLDLLILDIDLSQTVVNFSAREVGMRSHTTALLWHLGVENAVTQTSDHPLSATRLLTTIDDSMRFTDDELESEGGNQSLYIEPNIDNSGDDEDSDW